MMWIAFSLDVGACLRLHVSIKTAEIAMNRTAMTEITRREKHYRPFMRMVWEVLESAKDAGIEDVVAACRRAIVNDRIAKPVDGNDAAIIREAYADLQESFGPQA
jgi:hypothetical protein